MAIGNGAASGGFDPRLRGEANGVTVRNVERAPMFRSTLPRQGEPAFS